MPRFHNTEPHALQGLWGFLRWRWTRRRVTLRQFPLCTNDPLFLGSNRTATTLTWVGHATFLLQVGGLNILTDPHFSTRASPVQWYGPRRLVRPGLDVEQLPPIDVLLISHNHYDHLDRTTLKTLARHEPAPRACLAPLGLRKKLERWGLHNVTELDWWEHTEIAGLGVHSIPTKHSSARYGLDRNRTLWTGWVVEHPDLRFLFAGDTAYSGDFAEVRRRLGPIDLAALPIGAYAPRWFMRHVHATPEQVLQIHLDLDCRRSVAMHWGTFILTDEPLDEPPQRLADARRHLGLAEDEFVVLRHGETLFPGPASGQAAADD